MAVVRRSLDRPSSKLRRAARRLRKDGYTSQAGQMALAAEQVRMEEPVVMRPEHRALERQAQEALTESQRRASQPDFDYARDIAPLRGEFFSTLADSGMTPSEQAGYTRRYTPQFSAFDKDQAAFLQLQEAQRKTREQRTAAGLAPVVAQRIKDVMDSKGSSSEKNTGLINVMLDNPTAFSNPSTQTMFDAAAKSLSGDKTSAASQLAVVNSFYKDLASKGKVKELQQLRPLVSPVTAYAGEIAGRANLVDQQKELETKELSDIESKLKPILDTFIKGGATSGRDAILAAIADDKELTIPETGNNVEVIRQYLKLMYARATGISLAVGQPLPDPDVNSKFEKSSIDDLLIHVLTIIQNKQESPTESAPSATAQTAASGFRS